MSYSRLDLTLCTAIGFLFRHASFVRMGCEARRTSKPLSLEDEISGFREEEAKTTSRLW